MANPTVTLRQGTFRGTASQGSQLQQGIDIFLGIPYALPPTGDRRFRPPVRVEASTEIFNATQWGPICPTNGLDEPSDRDEDFLNLNVFRPSIWDRSKKLPVLVYIHGGAFNYGCGKDRAISSLVAWSPEPLIGVSFNYRLGALGFLPSKITAKEGLLNLGLKDQSLLLEWVQENISAFGGNPDDVTVMGFSAGAHSVGYHLMANTNKKPLFHKAIMESGAPTARAIYPYDCILHQKQFEEFLRETRSADISEDQIMHHLRNLPISTIVSASQTIFSKYDQSLQWAFQPVIEGPGGYISRAPIDAWSSRSWHKVPILTGFNTNEGASFAPPYMSKSSQFKEFFRTLLPALSSADLDDIELLYPDPLTNPSSPYQGVRRGLGAQFNRIDAAYGQFAYIAPVRQTAKLASAADLTSSPKTPVYLYQFAANSRANGGTRHGDQGDFSIYGPSISRLPKIHQEVAAWMHGYWVSFVITGDPNAVKGRWPDRPHWPAYRAGEGERIVFGEENTDGTGGEDKAIAARVVPDSYAQKECEFWWSKTEIIEGWRI